MKSFWEKASEIGSKAKSIATGYLVTDKQPKKDIEEYEKEFGEKFLSLKSEIDEFKRETIKASEEKLRKMNEKVKTSSLEKELLEKNYQEQILKIETDFCEKEKNYLFQLNDLENKNNLKYFHIQKIENSLKEINEQLKGCKIIITK